MLTQSAAGTGWVNERDPTVALGPGNGNQPLNHTPVIEKLERNFYRKSLYSSFFYFMNFPNYPLPYSGCGFGFLGISSYFTNKS